MDSRQRRRLRYARDAALAQISARRVDRKVSEVLQKGSATSAPATRLEELGRLVTIGAPVVAAQLAQMGMGLVDTLMLGRVSAGDLAGAALGGNIVWPAMILLMGVLMAVTPTVSQLHGAGRTQDVGEVIRQGVWIALVVAVLIVVLVSQAEHAYAAVGADPQAIPFAVEYVEIARWGLPGVMFYFLFRYLCDGLGQTQPAMYVAFTALGLKSLLNWIFVFGQFGLPAMGVAGCALSTAITMWFECFAMLAVVSLPRFSGPTRLFEHFSLPNPTRISGLVRLGAPIGLTAFFEMACFSLVTLLVARFGVVSVAAQQIAYSINGVVFMLAMGLGVAATIRVGYETGAGRPAAARRAAFVALGTAVALGVLAAAVLATGNTRIAGAFTTDPEVAALASRLVLFVALYIIVDNAQATAIGALRGYKDTRAPMLIALVGYWVVALPLGATLGFGWIGVALDVYGFWIGLAAGLTLVAVALSLRLFLLSGRAIAAP